MATLPAYLVALTEKGVHIVTVNDYLAKRDAEWMGRIYEFLSLSVGVTVSGMTQQKKLLTHRMLLMELTMSLALIIYGIIWSQKKNRKFRGLNFAIVMRLILY